MSGEWWRDIPGYEGYYQVSSFGRIKSLDRTIPHPRLREQFVAGRILSFSISENKNIKTGKPMIDLRVSLSFEGRMYHYNVRRLVYMTFVDPKLDHATDQLYVINIDGNGYNNRLTNLKAVTHSQKQKRAFKRKRLDSYLKTADRSTWTKPHGGAANRKPVIQYDLKKRKIASYESITQACKQTGFDEKSIINVAKGRTKQLKGFIWEYA